MREEKLVIRKRIGCLLLAGLLGGVPVGCAVPRLEETAVEQQEEATIELPKEVLEPASDVVPDEESSEAEGNAPSGTKLTAEVPEADKLEEDSEEGVEENIEDIEEEVLGDPRSSYGLGSAAYLKGKNVLLSLFVTTPESIFTNEEQLQMLRKIEKAATYIEAQAKDYGVSAELIYDFTAYPDLKKEAETDFVINEEVDFVDRLDEEIALWQEEILAYEEVKAQYGADGIATMIFVNNPGISYAIVYDGTDSQKETMILFSEDYYTPGKKETETAYAHEILHVFGAHDLYEDAEFTGEVTDYVALTYPREIMYTVTQNGEQIEGSISPITAYHLGWIEDADEIHKFPQLIRE